MGFCTKWTNEPVSLSINVTIEADGTLFDLDNDRAIPIRIAEEHRGEAVEELTIDARSSGYYDPGVLSGPPERCYPPEGDDERIVEGASITCGDRRIELSKEAAEKLFEMYETEIMECELPDREPDHHWDRD